MPSETVISTKFMRVIMRKWHLFFFVSFISAQMANNSTGAFGTVTMDGKIWNQLAFRPEFSLGNFGLALDLVFYLDENGNLHKEEWDFSDGNSIKNTLIDKIYYLRYGFPGDPLYGKMGALDKVDLGYGILVDGYTNAIEYPQVRKIGMNFNYRKGLYSYNAFINDLKENIGLAGVRMQTTSLLAFPVGFSTVIDRNQYLGLKDRDGDGRPDFVDDFPDIKEYWTDTDQDGFADNDHQNEFDRDGDMLPDIEDLDIIHAYWDSLSVSTGFDFSSSSFYDSIPDNSVFLKPDPLNLNQDSDPISAFAFDVSVPVMKKENISLTMYAQFAKMMGETINPENDSTVALGSGIIPLGVKANFGLVDLIFEYRIIPNGKFEFGYWNRSYEIQRATFSQSLNGNTIIATKESKLGTRCKQKGIYMGIQSSLFTFLSAKMAFQTLNGDQWNNDIKEFEEKSNQSFSASIALNRSISKLSRAELFYEQKNVPNPFEFRYSDSTVMGYRVGISMGERLVVNYIFKKMFRDTNGNGLIEDQEGINLTSIETSFSL